MGQPQRCTKCKRLRRGHAGPSGKKCTMPLKGDVDIVSAESQTSPDKNVTRAIGQIPSTGHKTTNIDPRHHSISHVSTNGQASTVDPFLNELAAQLGQLTLSMQELTRENASMRADIAQCKSANRFIPADGAPSTMLPMSADDHYNSRHATRDPLPLENHSAYFPETSHRYNPNGPEAPLSLMNGARITKKVAQSAKAGEFADLLNFIPNNEPSNVMETVFDDTTSQVVFRQKTNKKHIDSFLTWSQAWAGYEELLIESAPQLYLKCAGYRLFIQKHNALYTWTAVTLYDQRFRHILSMTRSFDFEVVDTNIAFLVFNALSVRPNHKGCFRCGSLDHHQKSCPFSSGGPMEKAPSAPKRTTKPSYSANSQSTAPSTSSYSYSRTREICFNYNSGKCADSAACGRRHVCSGCGGPDPFFRCFRCNPSPSHGGITPQQTSLGAPPTAPSR